MISPRLSLLALLFLSAPSLTAQGRSATPTTAQRYEQATLDWDAGNYPAALEGLRAVLGASDAATFHDRVAELTGEIWKTTLVAKDARSARFAPNGRYMAYEIGVGNDRKVRVVKSAPPFEVVKEWSGWNPSFTHGGDAVVMQTAATGLAWYGVTAADPAVARSGGVAALVADPTGRRAYGIIPVSAGERRVQSFAPGEASSVITGPAAIVGTPITLQPIAGEGVLVQLGVRAGSTPLLYARGFYAVDGAGAGIWHSATGYGAVVAQDGSTAAWIEDVGGEHSLYVQRRGSGAAKVVFATSDSVAGLALSADGAQLAFQMMPREDWELYTLPASGGAPTRITREIQHDLTPQFLANNDLLGVMGEGRHRRSYRYDLTTGTRTRLFHNNSVRTVAPEYEWTVAPDGRSLLIVSERDGDTVTPHRHLWWMDLTTKVSHAELLARVDSNLTAERRLRAAGRRAFASIASSVAAATSEVNISRIYGYQKDLFGFDSKHITQPGNWKATNYLLEKYRSFGLDAHLQRFRTQGAGSDMIEVANVVATIKGTVNPELVYVVGAHFDSRAEGPGADDNTSGTAMILEAARVLASRPLPVTVMFVSFTGEESGLRGAREFGRRMKDSIHVVGALNNDMMGWSNDYRLDNTIRYSNPGIRDIQHAAAIQFSKLITYDAFYYKGTDGQALYEAWGDIVGGIGSYPILGNPHYHMPHDVLETINHQLLTETSRTTVATIMLLASSPSRLKGLEATGAKARWTKGPEKGIVRYLVQYGPADAPSRFTTSVSGTEATLTGAQPGWQVAVKAVNARGLEGWDWARTTVR